MKWYYDKWTRKAAWSKITHKIKQYLAYPFMLVFVGAKAVVSKLLNIWPITMLPLPGWHIIGKWIIKTKRKGKDIETEVFPMPKKYSNEINKKIKKKEKK